MNHLIINADKRVVNRVIWEGAEFLPPRNHTVKRCDCGQIGDYWDEEADSYIFGRMNEDGSISLHKRILVDGKVGAADLDEQAVKKWEHVKDVFKAELDSIAADAE